MPYDSEPTGSDTTDMPAPEGEGEVHIPKENLPEGISEGDTLVCTGMDETGCSFKLQKGGEGKESWEDEALKSLSPRAPQEGAA